MSSISGMTGKLRAAKAVQAKPSGVPLVCYICLAYLKCHRGSCDGQDRIVPLILAASINPEYAYVFNDRGIEVPLPRNWDSDFINSSLGARGSMYRVAYMDIFASIIDCLENGPNPLQGRL